MTPFSMTSCCPPPRMRWSGATGAIARCQRVSTGYGRKGRAVRAWRWICGVKLTPKAVNKPSPPFIVHGLDRPGGYTTVSNKDTIKNVLKCLQFGWHRIRRRPKGEPDPEEYQQKKHA